MFQPRGHKLSSVADSCQWLRCGGVRHGGQGPDGDTATVVGGCKARTRAVTVRRRQEKV